MRNALHKKGIVVTEHNLPTAAWLNNFIETNDGCTYCSGELAFNVVGSFAYQIDAIIPHARGGPGYTEANMAAVSCFAFTLFMLLLTHSLVSFHSAAPFATGPRWTTPSKISSPTPVAFATTSTKGAAFVANRPAPMPRARTPWLLTPWLLIVEFWCISTPTWLRLLSSFMLTNHAKSEMWSPTIE
jgi:hypothetical protein